MASRRNASTAPSAAGSAATPGKRVTRRSSTTPVPQTEADREGSPTKRVTRSQTPSQQHESAAPTGLASSRNSAYGGGTGAEIGEEKAFSTNTNFKVAYDMSRNNNDDEDTGDEVQSQSSKASGMRRPAGAAGLAKQRKSLGTIAEEGSSEPPAAAGKGPQPGFKQRPSTLTGRSANDQLFAENLEDHTTVLGQGNPAFRDVEVVSHSAALANHVPRPGADPPASRPSRAPGPRAPGSRALEIGAPVASADESFIDWISAHIFSTWPLLLLFFFALACLQASLYVPAVSDHHVALGVKSAERAAWDFTTSWMPSFSLKGSGTSDDVLRRLFILETRVDTLSGMSDFTIKSLDRLKQVLPKEVSVRTHDGEFHVPDTFWHALKSKFDTGPKSSITWESWLKANEASISSWVNNAVNQKIRDSTIITSDEFADLVASNYDALAPQINAELTKRFETLNARFDSLESMDATVADKALAAVDAKYEHMLGQQPAEYLASLADANIRKTTDMALRSVNFFNPLIGAMVDPHKSSPTKRSSQNALASVYMWLKDRREFAPMTALRPWTDPGQCWCAAAADRTNVDSPDYRYPKAQLTVVMEKPVFAQQVTIEHVPRSGTLDKGSAPREMEMWVEMASATEADLQKFYKMESLSLSTIGHPGRGSWFSKKEAGINGYYVRVGEWTYDWAESAHHVQTFPVQMDLWALGVATKRVIVRAVTNHGAAYTCLYRIRLHGRE